MVTSQSQCDLAALELDLSDTSADNYENEGRPHGCVYASDNILNWVDPSDASFASAACGSTQGSWSFDCLCVRIGNHYQRNTSLPFNLTFYFIYFN